MDTAAALLRGWVDFGPARQTLRLSGEVRRGKEASSVELEVIAERRGASLLAFTGNAALRGARCVAVGVLRCSERMVPELQLYLTGQQGLQGWHLHWLALRSALLPPGATFEGERDGEHMVLRIDYRDVVRDVGRPSVQ